jgi:hypothetical protein
VTKRVPLRKKCVCDIGVKEESMEIECTQFKWWKWFLKIMKLVISINLHNFIYGWTMFVNHVKILIIIISHMGVLKVLTHVVHVYSFEYITPRNCILNHYNIPMYGCSMENTINQFIVIKHYFHQHPYACIA